MTALAPGTSERDEDYPIEGYTLATLHDWLDNMLRLEGQKILAHVEGMVMAETPEVQEEALGYARRSHYLQSQALHVRLNRMIEKEVERRARAAIAYADRC